MLKTFEPITTPTPVSACPATIATTADEISGASAPIAVTIPNNASEIPRRTPSRSSERASTRLAAIVRTRPPTKSNVAERADTSGGH